MVVQQNWRQQVAMALLCCLIVASTPLRSNAFRFASPWRTTTTATTVTTTRLFAGGGFGAGISKSKKKNNKKSKKKSSNNNGAFDVKASVARQEKRYTELDQEYAKTCAKEQAFAKAVEEQKESDEPLHGIPEFTNDDLLIDEYIVAVKSKKEAAPLALQDWVPVAQVCLARGYQNALKNGKMKDDVHDRALLMAVSSYVREIAYIAGLGSHMYKSHTRADLDFSVESYHSFSKYVYENVAEGRITEEMDNPDFLTKAEAMEILEVKEDELDQIKTVYRKKSKELHPDSFRGAEHENRTEEEATRTTEEYKRMKNAYETLLMMGYGRESGRSWYRSLGGKERSEFLGPLILKPISEAKDFLKRKAVQAAVSGMQPELVQNFLYRSHSMAASDGASSSNKQP